MKTRELVEINIFDQSSWESIAKDPLTSIADISLEYASIKRELRKETNRVASSTYYHNGVALDESKTINALTHKFLQQGVSLEKVTAKNIEYFNDYVSGNLSKKGWQCLTKFAQRHHRDCLVTLNK